MNEQLLADSLSTREQIKNLDKLPEGPKKDRLLLVKKNYEDAEPLLAQLRQMYPGLETPDELRLAGVDFSAAAPVLLHWLPKINNLDLKISIAAALSCLAFPSGEGAVAVAKEIRKVVLTWPQDPHRDTAVDFMVQHLVRMVSKDQADLVIGLAGNPGLPLLAQEFLIKSVSKAGKKRGVEVLVNFLGSDDERILVATIRALAHLRAKNYLSRIAALEKHHALKVRTVAAKAVIQLSRPKRI